MEVVGISSDEQVFFNTVWIILLFVCFTRICHSSSQDAIFRIVAAVLHLGNIEFKKGDEPDSSEPKDDQSRFHLKTVAELLM